jgi:hypothetical protein
MVIVRICIGGGLIMQLFFFSWALLFFIYFYLFIFSPQSLIENKKNKSIYLTEYNYQFLSLFFSSSGKVAVLAWLGLLAKATYSHPLSGDAFG